MVLMLKIISHNRLLLQFRHPQNLQNNLLLQSQQVNKLLLLKLHHKLIQILLQLKPQHQPKPQHLLLQLKQSQQIKLLLLKHHQPQQNNLFKNHHKSKLLLLNKKLQKLQNQLQPNQLNKKLLKHLNKQLQLKHLLPLLHLLETNRIKKGLKKHQYLHRPLPLQMILLKHKPQSKIKINQDPQLQLQLKLRDPLLLKPQLTQQPKPPPKPLAHPPSTPHPRAKAPPQ